MAKLDRVDEWLTKDLEKTKKCQMDHDFTVFLNAAGTHSQDGPWLDQNAERMLREISNVERSNLFRLMLAGVYANAYLIARRYLFHLFCLCQLLHLSHSPV